MLVSCLTATHGRFSVLRQALACFLLQDYPDKELVILNSHPTPIRCDQPGVRVLNEPTGLTLGDYRNHLLETARGELVRTWDDDDLYLPWAIRQGAVMIGSAPAFKPARSWFCQGTTKFTLTGNVFEASMTTRTEIARKYGYAARLGDEHEPLLQGIQKEGGCREIECGWRASYVYTWGTGLWHASGSLGNGTLEDRTRDWMEKNQDTGGGAALAPDDPSVRAWFLRLSTAAAGSLSPVEVERLKEALGV